MPRPKNITVGTPKLRQQTLLGFFESSSPPRPEPKPSGSSSHPSTKQKPRPKKHARRPPPVDEDVSERGAGSSSDVGAVRFEPEAVDLTSENDEQEEQSPRRPTGAQRRVRKRRADSDGSAAPSNDDGEGKVGVPVVWKGKGKVGADKRKRAIVDSNSEEEVQPKRRKLVKGVRPPTPDEDDLDLLKEVDEEKIVENRFRKRDKKSIFQQNLEKLKRKKRGERVLPESEEESEDEEEEDPDAPFPGAKPHVEGESDMSDSEDKDLDGFIEEDDTNTVAPQLPAEFSMSTYQDLVHHFKIICQLFVHLAVLDPEDRRDFMTQSMKDQYFSVPLQITRRKLTGMRDSLVTSSIWQPSFKRPFETYPEFETSYLDFALPGCDACHLGKRISTLIGRVGGEPYDRLTFETLGSNNNSDSSSDEEEERNEMKKEFHLGRFCAQRTRVFHRFTHWEYSLFSALNREVQELRSRSRKGSRAFVQVTYGGGNKPPEDLSDADGIMGWLDERGIINMEWQRMKDMMESARNLEIAAKRGDDDG